MRYVVLTGAWRPLLAARCCTLSGKPLGLQFYRRGCCLSCASSGHPSLISDLEGPAPPAVEGQVAQSVPGTHEHYMRLALAEASKAAALGEVPVGAVLVSKGGEVLAAAHNQVEAMGDPTAHAEMLCLQHGAAAAGGWRLLGATLYVTLEPCPMCAGALLQARVGGLVYGARNRLLGADGSWIAMLPRGEGGGADSGDGSRAGGSDGGSGGLGAGQRQRHQQRQRKHQQQEQEAERAGGDQLDYGTSSAGESAAERTPAACGCGDDSRSSACSGDGAASSAAPLASAAPAATCEPSDQGPAAPRHPFHPGLQVMRGVLGAECSALMKAFFRARRQQAGREAGLSSSSSSSDEGEQ